jgi:UPF0755 protein
MPKAIRLIIKLLSIFIALGLIAFALILGGAAYFNSPPGYAFRAREGAFDQEERDVLILEIKSGETAIAVGKKLESLKVIRNRFFWKLLFRLGGEHIKAGTYRIELPASQIKLRSILIGGEQLLVRVTIPEGVTLKKTAAILEENGICGAEDFLTAASSREILDAYNVPGHAMEGYLYPDTYLFPLNFPAPKVVSAMTDTFFRRLEQIAPEAVSLRAGAVSAVEINDRVIIASIVEREYRIPDEAALMAGVFYNRLKIGMALQSCATVEYVITEILGRPHPEVLYNRDIEIKDPYNTYIRPGLPPGPISAPGETALRAAFNPAPSDYLYFRLTDSGAGRHYFSRTLDDHIRAEVLYIKGK